MTIPVIQFRTPSLEQARDEVLAGRVRETRLGPYCLFNYRPCCQFDDSLWNPTNRACRGLVFDQGGQAIARPFPKFFNVGQTPESEPERLKQLQLHRVSPKFDGSLGIAWWNHHVGSPQVTTRGSFDSKQALWATAYLKATMTWELGQLLRAGWTYLFEIIYPENQIVVRYDFAGLVGLARVSPEGVLSFELDALPDQCRTAEHLPSLTLEAVLRAGESEEGNEGWVLTYTDGTMVKVKTADYQRLHRLVSGFSAKRVWEILARGDSVRAIFDELPDEFMNEALSFAYQFVGARKSEHQAFLNSLPAEDARNWARKDAALWAKANLPKRFLSLFFLWLDGSGRPYNDQLWNLVKPKGASE